MDEQTFMQDGTVTVTSARIEINGQTFATRNVGSVKVVAPGVGRLTVAVMIIGIALMANAATRGFGALVLLAAIAWAVQGSRRRDLVLYAGGGEVLALKTHNPQLAERIRAAIAQAIATR